MIRVPAPGVLATSADPPSCAARSRMLSSPRLGRPLSDLAVSGLNPAPLSSMTARTVVPLCESVTRQADARACFATFVNAS